MLKSTAKLITKCLFTNHSDKKCHDNMYSKVAHKAAARVAKFGTPKYKAVYERVLARA